MLLLLFQLSFVLDNYSKLLARSRGAVHKDLSNSRISSPQACELHARDQRLRVDHPVCPNSDGYAREGAARGAAQHLAALGRVENGTVAGAHEQALAGGILHGAAGVRTNGAVGGDVASPEPYQYGRAACARFLKSQNATVLPEPGERADAFSRRACWRYPRAGSVGLCGSGRAGAGWGQCWVGGRGAGGDYRWRGPRCRRSRGRWRGLGRSRGDSW